MNIGILAFETVYSAVSRGGNSEMRRRYAELRRRGHELTIRSFTLPDDPTQRPDLERNVLRRPQPLDVFSSLPYPVNTRRIGLAAILDLYAGADLVIVEGLQSSRDVLTLPAALRARTIVRVHNMESDYHLQMARGATGWRSLAHRLLGLQYRAYERRAARTLPIYAHISEDERRTAAARFPGTRHVLWPPLAAPLMAVQSRQPAGPFEGLLIMGDLTIPGNRAGAQWFVQSVFPALRIVRPTLTLHLVGKASEKIHGAGVVGYGYLEDLAGFLTHNTLLSVVPIAYGGGVKIKTIDTLASGLPAVYSYTALEGLRPDGIDLRAFGPLDTAGALRACEAALEQPAAAWARAVQGAEYASRYYGEAAQTAALAELGLSA